MSFPFSVVLIVPTAIRDKHNAISSAIGYDVFPGRTFTVPLSASGNAPATHYGAHTWARQQFLDIIAAAKAGQLPPIKWSNYGLTAAEVTSAAQQLISRVQTGGDPQANWQAALAANGLVAIQPPR